jgi:hypothetical protein
MQQNLVLPVTDNRMSDNPNSNIKNEKCSSQFGILHFETYMAAFGASGGVMVAPYATRNNGRGFETQ